MASSTLTAAKRAKNDEFYTKREDIEEELRHYRDHFAGKTVYCNCDDPDWSEFWMFFCRNFEPWGLKRLIATHYEPNRTNYGYMIEMNLGDAWNREPVKIPIQSNGDFRSSACIQLLKQADIVVTNPPFSLFREYIAQLMDYGKEFLVIGNMNALTYKEVFPLIKNNEVWLGFSHPKQFRKPDGTVQTFGNILWFTNLDHEKRHEPLDLRGTYYWGHEADYPRYDNYDAIEVSRVQDIPCDYDGVMGVPVTFLDKYCPEQFEIVGASMFDDTPCRIERNYTEMGFLFLKADGKTVSGSGALRDRTSPKVYGRGHSDFSVGPNGEVLSARYGRVFIRRK